MKKRIWVNSPVTILLLILVALLAAQNYYLSGMKNTVVLVVQAICIVAAIAAVVANKVNFRRYIRHSVSAAGKYLTGAQKESVEQFPLPVVVAGERGDLIWCNSKFEEQVFSIENAVGMDLSECLNGHTVSKIPPEGLDIVFRKKMYTVFAHRTASENQYVYLLYFIDNTEFKQIAHTFDRTRPSVAIASFDNLEELSQMAKPGEIAQLSAEVEMKIENWVSSAGGFVCRVSSGKYLIVWDHQALDKAMSRKFDLLDEVRDIHLSNRVNATLSIGVSMGGNSVRDCYDTAGQALDMALGRGGDQAVVRIGNEYKFFGGVSKGVEKRSRVRSRVVANALSALIENSSQVFVMGHRNSDLDCIGSAIGIWSIAAKKFNKPAHIVVDRESTLAGSLVDAFIREGHEGMFVSPMQALSMCDQEALLVIVDTHSSNFLESREVYDASRQVVVIDHHRKMVNYIDHAVIFYHEPYASSASEMVTELAEYLAENKLSQMEADALLSGIMLDTKSFVLKTGVRTFEAAAFLRRKGADTVEVKRLFANSFESYQLKYQLIANAQIHRGMAIAFAAEPRDLRIEAAQAADELLNVSGVDASFVLFPFEGKISISARSFGRINVQLVMEKIGGGGHLTMAGAQLAGVTVEQARQKLLDAIDEFSRERGILAAKKADDSAGS